MNQMLFQADALFAAITGEKMTIRPENVFNAELEQYQQKVDREYEQADREAEANKDLYKDCLNDETEFRTLCENYGLSFNDEIMRALRMLQLAIDGKSYGQDAVFTALHQIEQKLKHACEHMAGRD